jgi:hypothetical protein
MLDTDGAQTNSFRCADGMQIELEFHLDQPVDRSLIQYSLCNVTAKSYSGPTRSSWEMTQMIDSQTKRYTAPLTQQKIRARPTVKLSARLASKRPK